MQRNFNFSILSFLLMSIFALNGLAQEANTSPTLKSTLNISLEDAIRIALDKNPTVCIANLEIDKEKANLNELKAKLFPKIDISADYSRNIKKQVMYMDGFGSNTKKLPESLKEIFGDMPDMSEGIKVGRDNMWNAGITVGMPLINPSLWRSIAISKESVALALEKSRGSKIDMRNQVEKAFFAVLLSQDSYNVFKQSFDNASKNFEDIKRKFDQGLAAEYDMIRAEVQVRNLEPNLLQAKNGIEMTTWQLKVLMGLNVDTPINCIGSLKEYEESLLKEIITHDTILEANSALRQLKVQEEQLTQMVKLEKSKFLPNITLGGFYKYNAMNNDFQFKDYRWSPYSIINLTVTIPLFSGGERLNSVRKAKINLNQMHLRQTEVERSLQLAYKLQEDKMSTAIKRYIATKQAVKQAERGLIISKKRFETGAATLIELNDAELALTQAKLNKNQAIYDFIVAQSDQQQIQGKE